MGYRKVGAAEVGRNERHRAYIAHSCYDEVSRLFSSRISALMAIVRYSAQLTFVLTKLPVDVRDPVYRPNQRP